MHVKYYRKNVFVENVWPANLALFVYVSTHCVETIKWLVYNWYSQLTRWCSGNASALGARRPGFNPRLRQGFLCLIFCIVVVVFLLFLSKNTLFIAKYCNSFYNVNLFSILNVLQDLLPIIRVKRYRPSIFNILYIVKKILMLYKLSIEHTCQIIIRTNETLQWQNHFQIQCITSKIIFTVLYNLCKATSGGYIRFWLL